jgi:hypothetical protein
MTGFIDRTQTVALRPSQIDPTGGVAGARF